MTHISFPPSLHNADALKVEINHPPELPPRAADGHKGRFGDVLFVAGAAGYFGAPYFAALSFMKAGGGYSRLAAPRSIIPFIAGRGSEMVFVPMAETASGSIARENTSSLLTLSEGVDMVVIGPGLSLDGETRQLVLALAEGVDKPLMIDGDGITAVCSDLAMLKRRRAETILTPHMGEMSRITGRSPAEVDSHKVEVVQRTAGELGCFVVLKGAHSLIGYPDERVFVNMSGNSGMATAGSGDVLTGTIAAMHGLGLPIGDAVRKGVFVHGVAGDLSAVQLGEDGMTAQTILDALPLAVKADRGGVERVCGGSVLRRKDRVMLEGGYSCRDGDSFVSAVLMLKNIEYRTRVDIMSVRRILCSAAILLLLGAWSWRSNPFPDAGELLASPERYAGEKVYLYLETKTAGKAGDGFFVEQMGSRLHVVARVEDVPPECFVDLVGRFEPPDRIHAEKIHFMVKRPMKIAVSLIPAFLCLPLTVMAVAWDRRDRALRLKGKERRA